MTTPPPRRLTEFSHGAGCGCKLDPALLTTVLGQLAPPSHPDLLVGSDTGDDAAVWRLDDERALIFTTDFFTPLVDDPFTWGRIAATNAVSDVYAMGGRPILALNLVAWNSEELEPSLLGQVLEGALQVGRDAGFLVVGGHTIDDREPKYGLAVLGEAHPDRLLTNAGLRPGQDLVLTKPLGTGIVSTAVKRGEPVHELLEAAVAEMTRLNADAADAALAAGATGATDVTGFGLLGHLGRVAQQSQVDVTVDVAAVPLLDGVRSLAERDVVPGGSRRNLRWVADRVDADGVDELDVLLLADAQTSGGLVFGAEPGAAAAAVDRLRASGHTAAVIGRADAAGAGRMRLVAG